MKKKILALALVVVLAVTAVTGATLAYFTDTDAKTNTFTTGNVDISIREVVDADTHLMPGKKINKDVFVKNDGSEPAYVRVHIAIPADMDDGNPSFDAVNNFLHWNFTKDSYADGQWSWNSTLDGDNYPGNGGAWNYYEATIGEEDYAVYVATYETALAPSKETATESLTQVYMDASVDATANEDGTITYVDSFSNEVTLEKNEEIKILVFAEGGQVEGFEDAFTALNTQFGDPMAAGYVAPWNQA